MTCDSCESPRIARISAKHSDAFQIQVPHLDIDIGGYAPRIAGVCGGDYMRLSFCLDCGKIQGFKPISDQELCEDL